MVDRIQLGTTRKEDEKEVLTRKQYESSYVDFFSQTLGMPTLEEQTGIDVTAPKISGDSSQDTSDGNEDSQANLERDLLGALGGDSGALGGDIKFGEDAADFNFTQNYNTYGDFLKQQPGQHDRVEMFSKVFDPLTRGDFKDIKPGALFDSGIKNVQQIPGAVDQTAKDLQQTGLKATAEKNKEKIVGSLMGVAGGIPGSIAGGFINGTTTTNAFGNASFRPSGALGFVADMVHSKQYQDMAQIRAATAANASATGFAMSIGGFGITRAPGSGTYTGNMRGLSHVQARTLESLNKGYLPSSYNMQKETGTSLADAGYVSGRLSTGGYYKDNGTYMTATGQTAAFGMEADAKALGAKYGVTDLEVVKGVLANARNGVGTVSGLMAAEKAKIDKAAADKAAADKAAADKAAADKAAADRAAAQKRATDEINRRRQQEYGRDDSGGGYDFGDTGQTGATGGTADYGGASAGARGFADGGQVGMAAGGQMAAGMAPSGFIGAPPSQVSEAESVADNVNTQKQEGTFIINAAAVEFAGESDIMKMLKDAQKEAVRRGITVDNPERSAKLIDVAVSRGEVTVAPHLVKIIGEDRLTKINNRGKPEVKERIEENGQQMAAQGGFLENSQAYALGDKVKVYRGEPLDLEKVNPTDYGYGSDDVGKFHTPDKNRARQFAAGGGRGNQVILSRKVTMDQLFDGVEEAWKVQSKKKTGYFTKMPKKELDKNLKFIKGLRDAYASGERSVDSMVMFLQEQVFDGKSKIDFIETFKNDPLSGGKLLGRAINKVATRAAPPVAILERAFNATSVADATLGDSFLNSSATPDFTKNKN